MKGFEIHVAQEAERDVLLNTLMLAFSTDPCMRFLLHGSDVFTVNFNRFASAMGGAAFAEGSAYLSGDGAVAARWLPPGVQPDSDTLGDMIGALGAPERLAVLGEVGKVRLN
jgi:hypothetical protein